MPCESDVSFSTEARLVATINTLRPGTAGKTHPFTVAIIKNQCLETPFESAVFAPDPLTTAQFQVARDYIVDSLCGSIAGQAQPGLLTAANIAATRFLEILPMSAAGPAPICTGQTAFVGLHSSSRLLIARRRVIAAYLRGLGLTVDVAYAVTGGSSLHTRASAWPADDDLAKPTTPFQITSPATGLTQQLVHAHWVDRPGTVAIHHTATSLTAVHEFGHAMGSFQNGQVLDLYVDTFHPLGVNKRTPRVPPPAPPVFAGYGLAPPPTRTFRSDQTRTPIGYPPNWATYHPGKPGAQPASMDNYHHGTPPMSCVHDHLTEAFLLDRLAARMSR